ncbi:unknown [Clostridium sp. CAG:1000]|nr:unknown [Clostridium sp. CAG:1000]
MNNILNMDFNDLLLLYDNIPMKVFNELFLGILK